MIGGGALLDVFSSKTDQGFPGSVQNILELMLLTKLTTIFD
jgi:hypothetical protein